VKGHLDLNVKLHDSSEVSVILLHNNIILCTLHTVMYVCGINIHKLKCNISVSEFKICSKHQKRNSGRSITEGKSNVYKFSELV